MAVQNAEGPYFGRIIDCGLDENRNGKPFIYILCEVTHFASGGQWQELPKSFERTMQGLYVTDSVFSNPESAQILERKLTYLGFKGDFENIAFDDKYTTEGVDLVCKHEIDDHGNERERWDIAYPYERRERKQVGGNKVAALNSRWKQICKATTTPATATAAPPKMPPAKTESRSNPANYNVLDKAQQDLSIPDDDIPF